MRKSLVVLIALVTLALFSAAVSAQTIGLAISTLDNPFFVDLKDGAEAKAAELGVSLRVVDAQDDPARQLSGIEDLIARKVDLILVNPTDSAAVVPAILAANRAGIPVITIDRSADGGEVAAYIASDNVLGGKMAGEFIAELLGGKGKVVEIEGIPGTNAARERGQGFNEAMANYPEMEVVARQEAGFDRAKGLTVMENILQAQPEIDAVFCHNDEMALGAIIAIQAAGRADKIKVVGFDATDDAVAAVKEGRMLATVAQQPRLMGALGVEYALKVLQGEEVADFIPVPLELVK
ncbi:MAG TPA: ribose ABC transporter substrate-binding protein RbsB [Firmicutes bacterium]|jgi:ribose transport system substrate-binding protein|nr:ribose ABC transporter substrate-binding protein RbsB [Bacillota bacterium]HHT43611.1 ribose ABC transporter substrate-binding protein RbsB [Bacillota bacterium]